MADTPVTAAIGRRAGMGRTVDTTMHTATAMLPVVRRTARGIMPPIEVTGAPRTALMPLTADIAARNITTPGEVNTLRAMRRIGMADEGTVITALGDTVLAVDTRCTRAADGIAAHTTSVMDTADRPVRR